MVCEIESAQLLVAGSRLEQRRMNGPRDIDRALLFHALVGIVNGLGEPGRAHDRGASEIALEVVKRRSYVVVLSGIENERHERITE